MTQQQFAQAIDVAPATLSSIFNGRTKPTLNIVEAIKRRFVTVNVNWLLFGSGSMYLLSQADADPASTPSAEGLPSPSGSQGEARDLELFGAEVPPAAHSPQGMDGARISVRTTYPESPRQNVKNIDKPQRQITEIRVYFDDLTFETFVPAKK